MIFIRQYGANEKDFHFCFQHKYSNHRVRKVKQLLNLNGQNTIKNAKRIV